MSLNKPVESNDSNICKICENQLGKYTCPRCNISYCTSDCYKSEKHLACSEPFYKECVTEEFECSDNEESKAKMLEILQKFQNLEEMDMEELDSDDEDQLDLAERLEDINLDDVHRVWKLLTPDERQEFEAMVQSGDATTLVPIWTPWWKQKVAKRLVQEIGQENKNDYKETCPKLIPNIKPFAQLSKTKPADCVKYNILNVISAYTATVRYFNGDHSEFLDEFVYLLTSLSKNLQSNANFESYSLAIESTHQQMLLNDWIQTDEETKFRLYKDVENVFDGPEIENKMFYVKSALSDLYNLLIDSKPGGVDKKADEFSKTFRDIELPDDKVVAKATLKIYAKKIEYYLSYVDAYVLNFP